MISGKILRDAIISGANNINNQRSRVDELNVFPVPDGDTGTNMGMTVGAAVPELEALDDDCTVGEAAKTAASAMLRGARGNSGVITSLLFRGFSKALEGKKEAGAPDLVAALEKGVEAAYKAVMKPTEGTILTVARIASEEARASGIADVEELWDLVMSAGQRALDDTPNLLPVLKKAGVVDAGGQGIMIIFEGMGKVFHGEGMVPAAESTQNKAKLSTANAGRGVFTDDLMKVEDIKNGYCTQFLIHKEDGASAAKMRAFAESNGDSVVCIEDDDVINLHVHTADPGKILSEAIKYGYLTNFKIENMHEQFLARQKQGKSLEKQAEAEQKQKASDSIASEFIYAAVDPSRDYGFVAVAAGEGLKAVFTDAVQSVPAKTVFVLPNNKNIIMAAEQAEKLADRRVVVLPTRTIPMGITAMLNFDPTASVETNTINMMKAADNVSTGLIPQGRDHVPRKRQDRGHLQRPDQGRLPPGPQHVQEGFQLCHRHFGLRRQRRGCRAHHRDHQVQVPRPCGGQPHPGRPAGLLLYDQRGIRTGRSSFVQAVQAPKYRLFHTCANCPLTTFLPSSIIGGT